MGKKIGVLLGFLLAVVAMAAPDDNMIFTRMKISLSSKGAPTDRSESAFDSSGSVRNKWAVFTIDYVPQIPEGNRGGNRASAWIDDVILKLTVAFDGVSGGRQILCVFTGETRFWSIPLDGRKRHEVMAIPAHLLDRYLPVSGTSSTFGSNTFNAEAVFMDRGGRVIGRAFYAPRMSDADAMQFFEAVSRTQQKLVVENGVFDRSSTPWRDRNVDTFDLIKPNKVK